MKNRLPLLLLLLLASAHLPRLAGQDLTGEIDLLYPEFSHPERDVAAAIQQRDYRFIAVDRARRIVPGMEHGRRLRRIYGVRHLRQRFRLFPSRSENFSYNLRAQSYAEQYNLTLAKFLLAHHPGRF